MSSIFIVQGNYHVPFPNQHDHLITLGYHSRFHPVHTTWSACWMLDIPFPICPVMPNIIQSNGRQEMVLARWSPERPLLQFPSQSYPGAKSYYLVTTSKLVLDRSSWSLGRTWGNYCNGFLLHVNCKCGRHFVSKLVLGTG